MQSLHAGQSMFRVRLLLAVGHASQASNARRAAAFLEQVRS